MAIKIAINGYGRIGRSVARIVSKRDDIELVAVNDLADPATLVYLTNFDSVHGPLADPAELVEGQMRISGQRVAMFREPDVAKLRFGDMGVDVVL